eukprot:UN01855
MYVAKRFWKKESKMGENRERIFFVNNNMGLRKITFPLLVVYNDRAVAVGTNEVGKMSRA